MRISKIWLGMGGLVARRQAMDSSSRIARIETKKASFEGRSRGHVPPGERPFETA